MRPPRSLPASTAAWDRSRAFTAGPAMAVLRSVVRQMAAMVRAFGSSYVIVQVAIWHAYYAAHPWLLAGPLAAVAWGGAAAAYLRGLAARRAELASRSAAERAAVAAIQADRRERFALLELEALPPPRPSTWRP